VEPIDDDWVRVSLNVEHLDWVPALIASLDRPFIIEEPTELRTHINDLARRLSRWADTPETGGSRPDVSTGGADLR